jgi:hypothetical protein
MENARFQALIRSVAHECAKHYHTARVKSGLSARELTAVTGRTYRSAMAYAIYNAMLRDADHAVAVMNVDARISFSRPVWAGGDENGFKIAAAGFIEANLDWLTGLDVVLENNHP